MPQLIKNIQANVNPYFIGNVVYLTSITGEVQREDYIHLHNYTAYLQNLTQTEYTQGMVIPLTFGLKNQYNTSMITLQIDY